MPDRKLGALVLVFAACASGCARKPGRDEAIPPARDSGIALPSLDGLKLTKVAPLEESDGPADAEKWLRKVTVDVPAEGSPRVADARDASQWRGIAFETGCTPVPLKPPAKLFVKLDAEGDVTVGGTACKGLGDLRRLVAEATRKHPETNVVIDASPDVPYGTFLRVTTVLIDTAGRIAFHVPEGDWLTIDLSQVRSRLKAEIDRKDLDEHRCPKACIRIRAHASAPYRTVLGVMVGALREYVGRVTFVGVLNDREVEIGPAYGASVEPRDFTAGFYDPALEEEIARMGLQDPVFVHEEIEGSGIKLPALDGLKLTKVGPLEESDGPPGAEKWLRKVTVDVPAEGEPRVAGVRDASRWRGIALPRDQGSGPILRGSPKLIVGIVDRTGGITIKIGAERVSCEDVADFAAKLTDAGMSRRAHHVILRPDSGAPYGRVLPVAAVMIEHGIGFVFRHPGGDIPIGHIPGLTARIKAEAERAGKDADGLPNVCVRIRCGADTPYGAVLDTVTAGVLAYVWRYSLVGLLEGREVEIGVVYDRPNDPPIRPRPLMTVAGIGSPGLFGYRAGGGRRRAALRGGGSRKSEDAVNGALRWLARNQEKDGRWSAAKFGGVEGTDVAATGLATLTFLGAGHTERTGKHGINVRRTIEWIRERQDESGCIAKGSGKPGLQHAIAGLALAEAYAMAKVSVTGVAAQKTVDYTMSAQAKYSGWGFEPKAKPDMLVTGWTVAQLRSSLIAGLRVDGKGFQGAVAWINRVTEEGTGRVRSSPGKAPSPAATAVAASCLQLMGWKRNHPSLTGAATYLAANLPAWKNDADLHYWYWGSLAMFKMDGEHWKTWNASLRDMLVQHQRRAPGDPQIDGSWDPMGGLLKDTGRVGSTAMAAMCLEVYYRYLPLYK